MTMALNPPIKNWQGKRIWLVGASSGIGLALARELLQAGALLAVSARSTATLTQLEQDYPGQALALPLDVADPADWETAYQALLSWQGALDQLVFCAADYHAMRAWTLDVARASRMIDTNLKGPIYAVDTVLPDMLARQQGGIAIIASVAGYVGLPTSLIYGPTKAALINFCESLYLDLHGRGIAVTVINPGFVATPLTAGNNFRMPALISAEEAAQEIKAGLEAGEFEIHFPRRFTAWLKMLRHLPYGMQFKALRGLADPS
jgi:short-subunit dehydrogenase